MIQGSNADTLLGLTGMAMTDVVIGSEVTITIETTAGRVGCRECGVIAKLHDRRLRCGLVISRLLGG